MAAVPAACLALLLLGMAIIGNFVMPLQFFWTLLTGWVNYPFKVLPEVTINWEMWVCGIAALLLSLLIGHRFLAWLAACHPRLPSPWRFRTTFALTSFLLLLFGASIAMTGIVHQAVWLLRSDMIVHDKPSAWTWRFVNHNNLRTLKLALDARAADSDGKYPANLADIVAHGDISADDWSVLRMWRPTRDAVGEPWLYLGGSLDKESNPAAPVLVQPRPDKDGEFIILTAGGSVKTYRWTEVPAEVKAHLSP